MVTGYSVTAGPRCGGDGRGEGHQGVGELPKKYAGKMQGVRLLSGVACGVGEGKGESQENWVQALLQTAVTSGTRPSTLSLSFLRCCMKYWAHGFFPAQSMFLLPVYVVVRAVGVKEI